MTNIKIEKINTLAITLSNVLTQIILWKGLH